MYGVPVLEDDERIVHLIHPDFEPDVPEDVERFVQNVNLVLCINHKKGVFVWYFKNSSNSWSSSAMSVVRKAREEWVRTRANTSVNCYMTESAPPELAAVDPQWPDLNFEEILNVAFDGRTIHSANDPVIRGYQGKV